MTSIDIACNKSMGSNSMRSSGPAPPTFKLMFLLFVVVNQLAMERFGGAPAVSALMVTTTTTTSSRHVAAPWSVRMMVRSSTGRPLWYRDDRANREDDKEERTTTSMRRPTMPSWSVLSDSALDGSTGLLRWPVAKDASGVLLSSSSLSHDSTTTNSLSSSPSFANQLQRQLPLLLELPRHSTPTKYDIATAMAQFKSSTFLWDNAQEFALLLSSSLSSPSLEPLLELSVGRLAMLLAVIFMSVELVTGQSLPQQLTGLMFWL